MGPFLTIRRQAVVDLPRPWDPARVIQEYLDDPAVRQKLTLSDEQLATLTKDGVRVGIDAKHRWMGAMAGEMRIVVEDPLTVAVEIDGWATLRWWLRPIVLPFRPRMRRAVERQIDQLIEDLTTDIDEAALGVDDHQGERVLEPAEPSAPAREARTLNGLTWTLRVLTVGSELIYERTQDGTRAM